MEYQHVVPVELVVLLLQYVIALICCIAGGLFLLLTELCHHTLLYITMYNTFLLAHDAELDLLPLPDALLAPVNTNE